jgi:putative endonuclease
MNRSENKQTGNAGEDLAPEFLTLQKYKILGRNISYQFGEIDILAEDRGTIVVVEVKTVKGSGWGNAIDLVRHKKQEKLRMLALEISKDYPNKNIRIDVIGIDSGKISHIKNAVVG